MATVKCGWCRQTGVPRDPKTGDLSPHRPPRQGNSHYCNGYETWLSLSAATRDKRERERVDV